MFIHLRVHSAFSLLEGAMQLKKIISLAGDDKQPAVAVTDTANLFGALEFSEKAFEAGIQPIIGCTVPLRLPERIQNGKQITPVTRLPLYAANETGFMNLQRLISHAYLSSEGRSPSVSMADCATYSESIIALSGWLGGPVGFSLRDGDLDAARAMTAALAETFGDRFYCELQRHGDKGETTLEEATVNMAYDMGLPLVATNEAYFAAHDDYEAHDALIAIAEGRRLGDDDRRRLTAEHWLKPQSAMEALFADLPEAIENTAEVALRCSYRPRKRGPMLPSFLAGEGGGEARDAADDIEAEAERLRTMALEGLEKRFATRGMAPGVEREVYAKRLEHELSIITSMKFPGYFLIVADFIQWAKQQDIPVGPGRGSGAGSLVAYALTVTDLDPLRFDLLFERFLNPERVSMPDFDIDFCQDRRDEVITYVQKRYGADKVAQIITFGTLQARAVVRDVGRVLDMPYFKVDQLAKMVPSNPANPVTLGEAMKTEPALQQARKEDGEVDRLLQMALKLEGLYRHASTHAAGIVIGDRALEEIVPLYRDPRSPLPVSQYNMKWVESAGLVKFDFLGLKTLTTIQRALALIDEPIDLDTLPLDDKASYELLARGETAGVFQLESQGMRKALVGMKPDRFEDIIAIVALYRPGPMDNIPSYNLRKQGLEEPDYLHPMLEPILKETHGIIIYQEQVMQIAQVLSGYSLGEADLLRRAMGKKIAAEMAVQRDRFVEGAEARGTSAADANHIFDLVAKFANYGFNKSHAAAYALVAYHTAYLKANHPKEFLAASMTLDMGNTDKLNDFRAEAQRMGFDVKPPCVRTSRAEFTVVDDAIVYGLAAVKGVGRPLVDFIEASQTEPYKSLTDFANRLDPKVASKRALDALVCAGAFDCFGTDRATLSGGLDQIMGVANRVASTAAMGQNDFFGEAKAEDLRLPTDAAWTPAERLKREHDAIGFYLSAHPLDDYAEALRGASVPRWRDFAQQVRVGAGTRLAGVVISRQERRTKSGNRIAIVQLSDPSGQFEAVVFQDTLEACRDRLDPGACVLLTVTAQERDEGLAVRIQNVEPLTKLAGAGQRSLKVFIDRPTAIVSIDKLLGDTGACGVTFVALAPCGTETDIVLQSGRAVSRSVANAIRSMAGVVDVRYTETSH
ncbi:DNA polymerase III subunit alpha [Acuticoccus sp. MNP-M23]|uniref:DNA polymerase III subunit alpha n=1 Tax=Acuticoccus sp. MNP-M23 TaxID=3072793 RepID=UPI00281520D2|nr:DNA polymerase III subunit alpha [Acuticoccus sp. MNP-M23]WMS42947.1 DNA polymerase III subunit alpha [Acuticoccus sp. MNP-M23]